MKFVREAISTRFQPDIDTIQAALLRNANCGGGVEKFVSFDEMDALDGPSILCPLHENREEGGCWYGTVRHYRNSYAAVIVYLKEEIPPAEDRRFIAGFSQRTRDQSAFGVRTSSNRDPVLSIVPSFPLACAALAEMISRFSPSLFTESDDQQESAIREVYSTSEPACSCPVCGYQAASGAGAA